MMSGAEAQPRLRAKLRDMIGVASEPLPSVLNDPDVAEIVKPKRKAAAPRIG